MCWPCFCGGSIVAVKCVSWCSEELDPRDPEGLALSWCRHVFSRPVFDPFSLCSVRSGLTSTSISQVDFQDVSARTLAERKREEEKRKRLDRIYRERSEQAIREMEGE